MGPVSFNTGNRDRFSSFDRFRGASMGPVSFNTGNPKSQPGKRMHTFSLQWGQCLSTLETLELDRLRAEKAESFNGASVFQHWKPHMKRSTICRRRLLQWGQCLSTLETGLLCNRRGVDYSASMGPVSFNTGNHNTILSKGTRQDSLQWGQCLSTLETRSVTNASEL